MDKYEEAIAKLYSLETTIKYSEDRIDKLFRFVLEGNGRPSLQAKVLMLEQQIKSLQEKLEREDVLLKQSIDTLNETIDSINQVEKEEENSPKEEFYTEAVKGKFTVIAAIVTSLATLGGVFFSNLPALIEVMGSSTPSDVRVEEDSSDRNSTTYI